MTVGRRVRDTSSACHLQFRRLEMSRVLVCFAVFATLLLARALPGWVIRPSRAEAVPGQVATGHRPRQVWQAALPEVERVMTGAGGGGYAAVFGYGGAAWRSVRALRLETGTP